MIVGGPSVHPKIDDERKCIAVGDLNQDGILDLAWGLPGTDFNQQEDAGLVAVLFGSRTLAITSIPGTMRDMLHHI